MRAIRTFYQELTVDSLPLANIRCDYVILSAEAMKLDNSKILPDANGTFYTVGKEVVWGIGAEAMHTLYVGQTTGLIPVQYASDISVKGILPDLGQVVVVSCFREESEQELI